MSENPEQTVERAAEVPELIVEHHGAEPTPEEIRQIMTDAKIDEIRTLADSIRIQTGLTQEMRELRDELEHLAETLVAASSRAQEGAEGIHGLLNEHYEKLHSTANAPEGAPVETPHTPRPKRPSWL